MGQAVDDLNTLQLQVHKAAVVQHTFLEINLLDQLGDLLAAPGSFHPIDANDFAACELAALKYTAIDVDQLQVAVLKGTVAEAAAVEMRLAELAAFEIGM